MWNGTAKRRLLVDNSGPRMTRESSGQFRLGVGGEMIAGQSRTTWKQMV